MKLYRTTDSASEYWETWEVGPGSHVVHWGELGTRGKSKKVTDSFFSSAHKVIQKEIDARVSEGFTPLAPEEHSVLMIEYIIDGWGTENDLQKRHRLEDRMNETLGWTGLGMCDGGSIGSGAMEVCNLVVDTEIAKRVIEQDLLDTEFADHSRIYEGEA